MPDERFEDHLTHPRGRGRAVDGASHGAAGGAACGDLVRFSLAIDGDRVRQAGFEASGCGTMLAAGSAAVELVEGAGLLDAARIGSPQIAAELGGLSAGKLHAADLVSDALHRALGDAVRHHGALPTEPRRTLVAMSGGEQRGDRAARRARARRAGRDRHARAVGRRRQRRRALVLLGGGRPRRAAPRPRARSAALHARPARRVSRRRRRALAGRARRRPDAEPLRALQRARPPRRDARLRRPDRRRDADHRPLRPAHRRRPAAPRRRSGQGPDVHARRARPHLPGPAALPARRPHEGRGARDRRGRRPGRGAQARVAGPLLPGRHRPRDVPRPPRRPARAAGAGQEAEVLRLGLARHGQAGTGRATFLARHGALHERPGDIVDRDGRVLGRHRGHHGYTVGQRKGLGIAASEPLYVVATDARANTVTVGPRDALQTNVVRIRGLRLHDAEPDAVQLRYHAPALRCRLDGNRIHLDVPFDGAAPGQTAVFLRGDAIVGCATIA